MRVPVRGFQIFKDRKGVWRCYHRATRIPVNLQNCPLGSAAFFAECGRIADKAKPASKPKPGTLGGLIDSYRASPRFHGLAAQTRKDYDKVFTYLRPLAEVSLDRFTSPFVAKLRDRTFESRKRKLANNVLAVLSLIFSWGREQGLTQSNPVAHVSKIKRPRDEPLANRPWSDDERHAVLDTAPPQLKPALALMMFTGLGPKDAMRLPRTSYKDGYIATRRSKTGNPVVIQAPALLRETLASAPTHDALTLCANSRGQPWTVSGFNASWQTYRRELVRTGRLGPGATLYGLRHTVAVILREAGFDERSIADVLGQSDIQMARHYAKGADLRAKMEGVGRRFDAELNRRRTKIVKRDY